MINNNTTISADDYIDLSSLNSNMTLTMPSVSASSIWATGTNSVLTGGASTWATIPANPNLSGHSLKVKGDAEFDGDVVIKGKSINDSLERIEERLAILRPNEELEEKWENLRGLRKAYMELEAEIKEKEAMWGILKR